MLNVLLWFTNKKRGKSFGIPLFLIANISLCNSMFVVSKFIYLYQFDKIFFRLSSFVFNLLIYSNHLA